MDPVAAIIVCLTTLLHPAYGQVPKCCSLTTGSCRTACEQISLVNAAINEVERNEMLDKLTFLCSKLLVTFWNCINETFQEIEKGKDWYGRYCCHLPQSQKCRLACLKTENSEELLQYCRQSDELSFYSCLERQDLGNRCCNNARTPHCLLACKEVFTNSLTPNRQARDAIFNTCSLDNPDVLKCMRNYTHLTPAQNPTRLLHCCDSSSLYQCRNLCRKILRTHSISQEIVMDSLIHGGCGLPNLQDRLWQCFLSNTVPSKYNTIMSIDHLGMDNVKLQCCYRAITLHCQDLCIKIYSKEWEGYWEEFDKHCQYQLAESEMLHCLAEVDEPCKLGCEGLSYCTKFNYRPTELFRSCNIRSDEAAHHDVKLWKRGVIQMPQMEIPVVDISRCQPEMWKAIACILQIKPCKKHPYISMICKSDCIKILGQCVDFRKLQDGQTPATLCEMLSPPWENSSCISLAPYLVDSVYVGTATEITHPCKPNPCGNNETCAVNHSCQFGQICLPYKCRPGCKVGKMAQLMVSEGSYVRIPSISHHLECYVICQCKHDRITDNCIPLPCSYDNSCLLNGKRIAHNTELFEECKTCICFAGEIRCVQRCKKFDGTANDGFPCNCPKHHIPVCGINGKTYSSPCVARCSGLQEHEFEFGTCFYINPCISNPCPEQQKCIPHRQFCLSIKHAPCKQYHCVNVKNCQKQQKLAVCDTENIEHPNLCFLIQRNKTLAYFGPCLDNCNSKSTVCGHNGETYTSECAALSEYTTVDYIGACIATQHIATKAECNVTCQPLTSKYCNSIYLPETCCPVCGGAFQLFYSQKMYDQIIDATKNKELSKLSMVVSILLEHISVAECSIFAHPVEESSITIYISPVVQNPSALQVEACVQESEKLESLFQQNSPTVLTKVPLSAFIMVSAMNSVSTDSTNYRLSSPLLVIVLLFIIVYIGDY